MADFEGNPFADPDGINPFADPAVTQATQPKPAEEEYNPFAEQEKKAAEPPRLPPPPTKADVKAKEKVQKKKKPAAPKPPPPESPPAIIHAEQDPPPVYTPAPTSFVDPRDDELKKREEEIASREAALHERERNIERLGASERPNNFPPFPKFCPTPFKPCFYLNIKVEVPPSEQWKMYFLLALLIYLWVVLTINVIVAVVGAITIDATQRNTALITMGVAILYWVLFVPGALFCWFLPAYYAYKKDSSLAFMWFFFVMLFQVLSFILNAIGAPNLGACGFFNGAAFFTDNSSARVATGAMFMIMGFAWALGVPVAVILILLVHRYYRISGASLNKATSEAVAGVAQNKYVRSTVKEGVKAGVSGALSGDK